MACNCKKNNRLRYKWVSGDSQTTILYDSEMAAKAKVIRVGGSYVPVDAVTGDPVSD